MILRDCPGPQEIVLGQHLTDLPHLDSAQQGAKAAKKDGPSIPHEYVLYIGFCNPVRRTERHQSDNHRAKDVQKDP